MKLEAIRGISAVYVFIHHYVHGNEELVFLKKFFIFGQFALMIFFILSGLVIYYATVYRKPDMRFGEFIFRRIRRIYPALLAVLVLTYLLRSITSGQWLDVQPLQLLGNIFQLQDKNPISWVDPYWQNAPLWSLAYEWWFYMFFFAIWKVFPGRPLAQRNFVLGLSLFGFVSYWLLPNQFSLFFSYLLLWWSGLEIAREWTATGKVSLRRQWKVWGGILGMGLLWAVPAYLAYKGQLLPLLDQHPFAGVLSEYLQDKPFILADFPNVQPRHFLTVFLVLCAGFVWYKMRWLLFDILFKPFTIFAPISYAIYIFHYPVIYLASIRHPLGNVWLDLIWVIPTVLIVSWVIEVPFQKWINQKIKYRPRRT